MNVRNTALLTLSAIGLLTLSPFAVLRTLAHGDEHHPASAPASAPAAKTTLTVKGEVVDLGCYLGHNLKGASHTKCAQTCAARGMPIALLAENGTLYLLTMGMGDPKPLSDARALAGTTITITGDLHEGSGIKSLEVKKVEA